MASLKEVKGRIISANNTLKITSAMKMVASAKLHKAQDVIAGMLPYERQMSAIMTHFLQSGVSTESPFTVRREVKRKALVILSSNSSLCGGFNSNVIRRFQQWVDSNKELPKEQLTIYPLGRKITDAVKKMGFVPAGDYTQMVDKPSYKAAEQLADELCRRYLSGDFDQVDLIYHHFKSAGSQELLNTVYLPFTLPELQETRSGRNMPDYLIEPSAEALMERMIPEVLKLQVYTMVLDSNASEHAARSVAMQIATDNANNLIQDLTVAYNKGRQQAITSELLDIMGGTMS